MVRLFQWLDDLFSVLVVACYLAALATGSIVYFGGFVPDAVLAVGTALGFAVEIHSWLQQRRVRAIYGSMSRLLVKDPRREVLKKQLWVQGGILLALVAFSMWNSNLFL